MKRRDLFAAALAVFVPRLPAALETRVNAIHGNVFDCMADYSIHASSREVIQPASWIPADRVIWVRA